MGLNTSHVSAASYVRALVSGKTGTTKALTHTAERMLLIHYLILQRLHIKILLSRTRDVVGNTYNTVREQTRQRESKTYRKGDMTAGDGGHETPLGNIYKAGNKASLLLQNFLWPRHQA